MESYFLNACKFIQFRALKFEKIFLRYPDDKLACEHSCDTVVYECLNRCYSDSTCMRQCWLEYDKCIVNCPCNEECPNGCPNPYDGHPCKSWFCQGELPEVCALEYDPVRIPCPGDDQSECLELGCCWVLYNGSDGVPWCHYPKLGLPST